MKDSDLFSGTRRLDHLTRRRLMCLSAGAVATGLAGCTGIDSLDTGSASTNGSNSGQSPTGASTGDTPLERFDASDIRIGETSQRVQVDLSDAEPGDEIDVYADFTSLTEANIGTENISIVAETAIGATGWLVTGAEIVATDGIVVRVTVEVQDMDAVSDFAAVNIDATGLETDTAEPMADLTHSVTLSTSDGQPDFSTGETARYDVIDPAAIENVLRVSPSDLRIGERSQTVSILIERATDMIAFSLDLAPLRDLGADTENADVVVEETAGERRNDEGEVEIDVTEATVVGGAVQLNISTTADTLAIDIRITGLDTEGVEATSRVTYPVYTGDRPSEPTESGRFSISGAAT